MKKLITLITCLAALHLSAQVDPSQVEIIRDHYGVPHIYAPTDAGVSYGLAWAHSEDDFGTIQLTLLAAKNMLGRHLGKGGAAADYVSYLLRCKEVVKENIHTLSPEYLKVINGYTDGINAYAKAYPEEVLVEGAFPVSVEEVLSAYVLSLSVMSGADKVISGLVKGEVSEYFKYSGKGSNAFAFSRKKTDDGNVYLNVNSHQPLDGPSSWYEAHLVSDEGWNMMGGLFPGAATVFHGTNENLGWAHTVNYPDKIDVYQLEMHPKEALKYKFDNDYKTLEQKEVKISVQIIFGIILKVKKTLFWSEYGPVVKNDKGFFAFDLGALHDIRAPEQWYKMNKANNFEEWKSAVEMVAIPGFNFVYADRDDNIFYLGNAKIPLRDSGFDWNKTLPGNTSKTLHKDYHSLADLPQVLNPASGYVFNTNNSAFSCTGENDNPQPSDYDVTMGYRVFENNRSERFKELMNKYDRLRWKDFLDVKYDDTLPSKLSYPVNLELVFSLDSNQYKRYAKTIGVLQRWDRSSHVTNVGAAQFMILYRYLVNKYKEEYTGETYQLTEDKAVDAVRYTQRYLKKNFKKIDISLGEYQKLIRGKYEIPVPGIMDVIAAMDAAPYKDGKVRAIQGESYIMLVRYPEEGLPVIETINCYGASNRPDSPHYADQMVKFVRKERKPMTLDIDQVREDAEAIYHPVKKR